MYTCLSSEASARIWISEHHATKNRLGSQTSPQLYLYLVGGGGPKCTGFSTTRHTVPVQVHGLQGGPSVMGVGGDGRRIPGRGVPLLRSLEQRRPVVEDHEVSQDPGPACPSPPLWLPQAHLPRAPGDGVARQEVAVHPGHVDLERVLARRAERAVGARVGLVARVRRDVPLQDLAAVAAPKGLAADGAHQRCHVAQPHSQALQNTATLSLNLLHSRTQADLVSLNSKKRACAILLLKQGQTQELL